MQQSKRLLLNTIDRLIDEGDEVVRSQRAKTHLGAWKIANPSSYVDMQSLEKWRAGCQNLMRILGKHSESWKQVFDTEGNRLGTAKKMLGTLEGIRQVIDSDLLVSIQGLLIADTFVDLLEQARHLLANGYYLAAGVIGRAVLEEHLRKWCENAKCEPQKERATLNDLNNSLYKNEMISKIDMKHVESLAAVGNDAAHNIPSLKQADVDRMLREVTNFIQKHPLS